MSLAASPESRKSEMRFGRAIRAVSYTHLDVYKRQVISNVPAAVLLAGFTSDWKGLLLGVDVGGLGTLIASLASLISFKLYCATPGARAGKYLLWFTAANVAALVVLIPLSLLLL